MNITAQGVEVPKQLLSAVRNGLTVKNYGFQDKITSIRAYWTGPDGKFYGARWRTLQLLKRLPSVPDISISDFSQGHDCKISSPNLKLLDYQIHIVQYLLERKFNTDMQNLGVASALLKLNPGRGKTFIAMELMQRFGKKTLFIVPNTEMVTQTVAVLKANFPNLIIGEFTGTRKIDSPHVMVMTINSAIKDEFFGMGWREYMRTFGFTIFDEVHEYCTGIRSSVFWRCSSWFSLGISGTPSDRLDGMDPISHYWLGKPWDSDAWLLQEYKEEKKSDNAVTNDSTLSTTEWITHFVCLRYNAPPQFAEAELSSVGTVSVPKMINKFSCDPWRSQLLVNLIEDLLELDHRNRIFVFVDRTLLAQLVRDYIATLGVPVGVVLGIEKTEHARANRIVIGTYACIGTGISWDEFNCLVCWHPRRNKHKQFINRIFRNGGDRSLMRRAYFLQDNATSVKSQYSGFSSVCKKYFNTTPKVNIWNWQDIQVEPAIQTIADKIKNSLDSADSNSTDLD